MAVFDILPDKNLRAVDIRDTLLANGADWSNEEVKDANYIPNYFKEGAKINKWSRYKPINILENKLDVSESIFVFYKFGLSIIHTLSIEAAVQEIRERGYAVGYNDKYPSTLLRLSDFRRYNSKAVSPNQIKKVEIVHKGVATIGDNYHTLFKTSATDSFEIKTKELFGYEAAELYPGVIVDFGGDDYFWGNESFNWNYPQLKNMKGVAKITHILTSIEVSQNLPFPVGCEVFVAADDDNYYDCLVTNQYPDNYFKFYIMFGDVRKENEKITWELTVSAIGREYRGGKTNGLYVTLKHRTDGGVEDESIGTHQISDFYCEKDKSYKFNGTFLTSYNNDLYLEVWEDAKKWDTHWF